MHKIILETGSSLIEVLVAMLFFLVILNLSTKENVMSMRSLHKAYTLRESINRYELTLSLVEANKKPITYSLLSKASIKEQLILDSVCRTEILDTVPFKTLTCQIDLPDNLRNKSLSDQFTLQENF